MDQESQQHSMKFIAEKLYKDSLAFRILRMHGYNVSPRTFSWFLHDNGILQHLENNFGHFTSLLYTVYKATDLMFIGEKEVDEARSFSRKMLQKISTIKNIVHDNLVILPNLSKVRQHRERGSGDEEGGKVRLDGRWGCPILVVVSNGDGGGGSGNTKRGWRDEEEKVDEELSTPWIARLDHLDHRMWIEQTIEGPMWVGKASFYRLSCVHNMRLMQLAIENYTYRQFVYQNELEELKRWSKMWGLTEMGFCREKTLYCCFAIAASTYLPHDSIIRMIVAKSAILVTVADDFFDIKGSLEELHVLVEAINRWDGEGLRGPSSVIFHVLDDIVRYATMSLVLCGKTDLTEDFTACFLNPSLPKNKVKPEKYENITQSLMATTRLLNDIQSYQKEQEEGIMNLVLLHFNKNPDASMDDSVSEVQKFLESKRKELLKHVFTNDDSDFPNQWRSAPDTEDELQSDIHKAIYAPPEYEFPKYLKPQTKLHPVLKTRNMMINAGYVQNSLRDYGHGSMNIHQLSKKSMRNVGSKVISSTIFGLSFI
ncbi:hypothetical protein L1987_60635 [Smallanthus sonchifolius]|uniref:Uncharacterized protein n=1 Tax=Smallanthus sonchifolius TaxID=185202 RepID=A0ACB9D8U2_9ASTR|nr:hypothetical protein L1987_60635 [Smallanthus sonchifolius]